MSERSKLSGPLSNKIEAQKKRSSTANNAKFNLYIETEPGEVNTVRKELEAEGFNIRSEVGEYLAVDAYQDEIKQISSIADVRHVRQRRNPKQHQVADKYITEGEEIVSADILQTKGITGDGSRIAVIDHKFHTDNPKYNNNIIATIGPDNSFTTDSEYGGSKQHGTACAEIIADLAPDAELILASTEGNRTFDELMTEIESYDPDGASMSLGFYTGLRIDGDDIISQRISQFTDNDRLFTVSAGNEADGGHWDGSFQDNGEGLMEFDSSLSPPTRFPVYMNPINVDAEIHVHWDADWSTDDQEYEARLYADTTTSTALDISRTTNPQETLVLTPTQNSNNNNGGAYYVEIEKIDANGDQHFDLFTWGRAVFYDEYSTARRSLGIPATSTDEDTLAIAAVQATDNYGSRDSADKLATYSSRGPTQDGRRGLDISAPTVVSTTKVGDYGGYGALEDGGGFAGTSAACPHVGGIIGLLEQFPTPTSTDIKKGVLNTARNISDSTVDSPVNSSIGYGHYEGQNAMEELIGLQQKWSTSTGGRAQSASPALDSNHVYIGGLQSELFALDTTDRKEVWSVTRSGSLADSSPVVADGAVFVGSGGGTMYALSASDGSVLWTKSTDSAITSSPVILDSIIYYGTNDGRVQARQVSDGSEVWTSELGGPVYSSLAAKDGLVFVTTNKGTLYCLDSSSGSIQWQFDTGTTMGASSPTLAGGNVFIASNKVYSLNDSGASRWEATYGGTAGSSPAYLNGRVFVGSSDGSLYAFDDNNNGSNVWTATTGDVISADPAAIGIRVLVPSEDGTLYAFHEANGTSLGATSLPSLSKSSPVIYENSLYMGTSDGTFVVH